MTVALQVITGVHVGSDGGFVSGRVARATPVAGQFIDHSTVDSTVLTSPISGSDGTWSLTLICGVVYDVKIDRWAVQTIRVTDDATLDFSWYLEQSLELVNGGSQIPSSLTPAMVTALSHKLTRPLSAPAGKQLTFDAEGDVVASSYDVGAAGGGGLASADDLALALYSLGMLVVVAGPQIEGTDPPQMAPSTAAQVAHLIAIGIPEAYIGWSVTGSEAAAVSTSGSFDLPSISLTPTIVAPSLNGLQGGGFSLPQVSLQPMISAPTLSGIQQGSFSIPSVSLQPAVAAPQLDGVQAGVGSFTLPVVSLRPVVAVPTLAGVQVGSFATPAVSLQPAVSAPTLTGVQVGSIALPSVSLRPVVAAPTLTGVSASTGSITLPAVSLRPVVAAPTLTGVTASSGISFETDFTPYTASGSVVRDNAVAYDGTWSAKIPGAASGGRVSTLSRTTTAPSSGTKTVERWFRVAGTPADGGTATIAGALDPVDPGAWWGYFVAAWGGDANYNGSNIPMSGRVGVYTTGYGTVPLTVDPLTAGVWYRVVVVLNFTAKTYTVTLYDAVGTAVPRPATYFDETEADDLALPTVFDFPHDFSGASFKDIMDTNNAGTGFSLYVDKIDNGGL